MEFWEPAGEDLASRIEERIRAGTASERDLERLVPTYEEEGRPDAARRARVLVERYRREHGGS